jgi:hypothetical protein
MVKVDDRIRLLAGKGPDREGVVTALTGSMVRVRWPSGEETTVIPAPGTLTVIASPGDQAPAARRQRAAPKRAAGKKTAARKTAARKTAAKTAAPQTAPPVRSATKKPATVKQAATKQNKPSTKGGAKKTKGIKGSAH